MSEYPNIEAIARGTISGAFREWSRVMPEAKAVLAEVARLIAEVERLRVDHDKVLRKWQEAEAALAAAKRKDYCAEVRP